ncbi:MAG: AI-2E family transporter, partial [Candidatus Gracilibacteria bacterium]|nr:AI-2E family transporter [Candidatus Gracilibacteria bacterium]
SRALDISPFLILLTMTVMASLFGIPGILLAIPLTALLQMAVRDVLGKKQDNIQIATKKK